MFSKKCTGGHSHTVCTLYSDSASRAVAQSATGLPNESVASQQSSPHPQPFNGPFWEEVHALRISFERVNV